jgi:hypothetical protein
VERLLGGPVELLGMADTPSGTQGAKLLTLRALAGARSVVFRAKWRPQSSADLINEPRKELAAYAVQKLFLEGLELVVPPTVAYCFPLESYRRFAPNEAASFDSVDCVLGFFSYWLESVETVSMAREEGLLGKGDGIWDAQLFARDPTYKTSVAECNLLTFLINHGDAHTEQFLVEQTPYGLRAYVVDNSIAFRSIKNPMLLFRQDWSSIQVPWLPPRPIERLRQLTPEDFSRLGTIAVLERRERQLVGVPLPNASVENDGSSMSWSGSRLRIGLTRGEIELVRTRVRELLARPELAQQGLGGPAPALERRTSVFFPSGPSRTRTGTPSRAEDLELGR